MGRRKNTAVDEFIKMLQENKKVEPNKLWLRRFVKTLEEANKREQLKIDQYRKRMQQSSNDLFEIY